MLASLMHLRSLDKESIKALKYLVTHHSFVTLWVAAGSVLLLLPLVPCHSFRVLGALGVSRTQPLPPPLVRHFQRRFLKVSQVWERAPLLGQLSFSAVRTRPVDRAHTPSHVAATRRRTQSSFLTSTRDSCIQLRYEHHYILCLDDIVA